MESKRKSTRVECNYDSSVEIGNVVIVEGYILNISLGGILLEIADDCIFKLGDKWRLRFKLPNSNKEFQFETEVVRSDGNVFGMKFLHMDADANVHLRYLQKAKSYKLECMAI